MSLDLGLSFSSRAASGRGFSPLSILGLSLWLDSSDINTFNLRASQYVAAWNDKSGNVNHFQQSILANQPEYQLNQQNGLATVSFDDVNQGYLSSVNDFITTDTDTWFFVFQTDLNGADNDPTLLTDYRQQAANPFIGFRSENKGSQDVFFVRDTTGQSLRVTPTLIVSYSLLIGTRKPGTITTDYNDAILSASGLYGSQVYDNVGGPTPMLGSQAALAPPGRNASTQMKGHVAEVLRYSRELNATEKGRLKTYLKNKWGL